MTEESSETAAKPDRLCSEIQLFDLCDLDSCNFKKGKFCTNAKMLAEFESIQEQDDRSELVYEELEEDDDFADFDDGDDQDYEE